MHINTIIREATLDDARWGSGLPETIDRLTPVGNVTDSDIREAMAEMFSTNKITYVLEIEDRGIVATASIQFERKLGHRCGRVGHVEDVVTQKEWERNGFAFAVMKKIIERARMARCYKIILQCSEENRPFYEKLGFYLWEGSSESMRYDIAL